MKPLNFIKQVLSMFCSIHGAPLKDISDFLLSPEKTLDTLGNLKLTMFLNVGLPHPTHGMAIAGELGSSPAKTFSQLSSYPISFILYHNGNEEYPKNGVDITSFCSCEYNKDYTVRLTIPVLATNSIFSNDFRTVAEIKKIFESEEH